MKILLVCESFSAKLSGGKVVRYLHRILTDHGHEVRVAITSPFDKADTWVEGADDFITVIPSRTRYYQRLHALGNKALVPHDFSCLVDRFQPEVAHFASFDHAKSSNLYWFCKQRGIRIVLQPWTMHFYCAQGFGFRGGQQCTRCITDGFATAIREGCTSLRGSVTQLERAALRKMATTSADVVLSSNSDLDAILVRYGVPAKKIRRFPIAFDTSNARALTDAPTSDYFIYYGQANDHKGTRFLIDLFALMPDKQLRLYPMAPYTPERPLTPNIKIIPGLGWDTGLGDAIARAKAVVLPSLWATSTEYSLCEAMTMGKPVIVFRVGVHKDILTPGRNALVIEVGDPEQFRDAVNALDSDASLRARLAEGGVECMEELNAPATLYAQLIDAYSGGES